MGDSAQDSSAFAAAPPSGLGNFKGVMLCNRPPDGAVRDAPSGQKPFKPMCAAGANDPLGLPPARDQVGKKLEHRDVKTRGPSAALRNHVRWLKELESQVKQERQQAEGSTGQDQARKQKLQEHFKRQRDAVRELKAAKADVHPEELGAALRPTRQAGGPAKALATKPAWALSAQEKDEFDEGEAEDLLRFAEGLDFEQYVGDLEFRQGLSALRDNAKRLQREQDAFKDSLVAEFSALADGEDDYSECASNVAESQAGGGRRSERCSDRGSQPDWDASTAGGGERSIDHEKASAAAKVLQSNSQIRSVHSKASVQRLVDKAQRTDAP